MICTSILIPDIFDLWINTLTYQPHVHL